MNPLKRLNDYGQVIWLDFLSRRFIADGSLKRLIDEDGLAGVTSNPSIFEKAIVSSSDYDASLEAADRQGKLDERALFERVAVEDIQAAADVLRPVYEATRRRDGYVSIEVSPYLAMRTEETVAEARRLWHAVGRENLMIKVPATTPGPPAIQAAYRRRDQRQHHAALFAEGLRGRRRGVSQGLGRSDRTRRRPGRDCERRQFLCQSHRHSR